MPVAFVVGAGGQIGRFLLPRLLDAGWQVLALSRQARPPSTHPRVNWVVGDLYGTMPELPAVDTVFGLGPLDGLAGWLPAARCAGIGRVVAFGSMSAVSKRASTDASERRLAARLLAAEAALAAEAERRGAAWTVLRPTLIYGAGIDRSLTPIARFAQRSRLFPRLVGGGRGLRQPVHAEDLATACLAAAGSRHSDGRIYPLGGGERLPFAAMLERMREGLGLRTVPLPLPVPLLRQAARLRRGRDGAYRLAAAVERLAEDLVADNAAAAAELGWSPRAFRPDAACWRPAGEVLRG